MLEDQPVRSGVTAVDWSGDRTQAQRRKIWRAQVVDGEAVELESGLDRAEVVAALIRLADEIPELVVGLDFPFGMPEWFTRDLGASSGPEAWEAVAELGERWLAERPPPFFGPAGTKRPEGSELLRRTDRQLGAKSPLQIGGPGAPGTGGIRGMPLLRELRAAGFAIWPFDDVRAGAPIALEVYPRAFTGPVNKSDRAERQRALDRLAPGVPSVISERAVAGDDAFDALITALAMDARLEELRALPPGDGTDRREGRIWSPGGE